MDSLSFWTRSDVSAGNGTRMEAMMNVWAMVEHVRVASGAAELAIFTAILYWFFTSSRVADMLEVVGERVGGWCGGGREASLRQAVRARRRHQTDVYAKLDADHTESWQDPESTDPGTVINILDIGRQAFANGGVVSRYLCDLAQCLNLIKYNYDGIVPSVVKDERYQKAIEETTREEMRKSKENGSGDGEQYMTVRQRVENRALRVLTDISSAMSNNVLKLVAWLCHKAVRRIAGGGCGTRIACVERLRRAKAAGLPLIFVPLHRSHFDYILVTFTLYLTGLRPPLVAAGDNMRIPFFGWFLRGCGAFYIRRRVDGSEYHGDPVYKTALRAYILNSLAAKNNLEFFIEGGRTRTGKPQPPKAGILSVIMDAYLDGTIDDALLVPVTLNYDRLVDGNFVREQLGMRKQMETFWSALRGIWSTLNTNHGAIRVDFNQPISLKELVTSFQKYNYLKSPIERPLSPANNNLSVNLDRQILYNHSHSSLYGADVSTDHKMMVEAIGRHVVYDAAQATALMCTNILSYILLTEARSGCSVAEIRVKMQNRANSLCSDGRVLGYTGDNNLAVNRALDMLGRSLVRREGSGVKQHVAPQRSIAASLELSYYANTLVAHYAQVAIVATALESLLHQPHAEQEHVRHSALVARSLQLCELLSQEFILCAPCHRLEETITDAVDALLARDVLIREQSDDVLEEERWARRFAKTLEEDDEYERPDPMLKIKYRISRQPDALAERRRLLLTIRPLLEAYAASCRNLRADTQRALVKRTIDSLTEDFTQNKMVYGEAVSMDAIKNCHRVLRQWGVIEMYTDNKERKVRVLPPYDNERSMRDICENVYRYNMNTELLK